MPQKCNSCGTYNKDAAKFCRNCGKELSFVPHPKPNDNGQNGGNTTKPTTGNNNRRIIFGIIFGLICLGAVIGGFIMFINGEISKPVATIFVVGGIYGLRELFKD